MTQAWSATRFVILGVLFLFILVGGFGSWAAFSQIEGAVIASGRIEVEQNRQPVQHPYGGVVSEIAVREGDRVEAGDVLLALDTSLIELRLAASEDRLDDLNARQGRLNAEARDAEDIVFPASFEERAAEDEGVADLIEGQTTLFEARRDTALSAVIQLEGRKEQVNRQIDGLDAQSVALREQVSLIGEEIAAQQTLLDRGLTQASRVLDLRRNEVELQGRIGDLQARTAEAAERLSELDAQIQGYTIQRREEAIAELSDIAFSALEYRETIAELKDQIDRSVVTAPVSGVIYGMTVNAERAVIREADPILYIVPDGRPLIIAAEVAPIHVDQVDVGQDVLLRFPTFDATTTPELFGEVIQVSADSFTNDATGAAFYRAEIVLSESEQERLPEGTRLIPGMPVETFLRTDARSPLSYLVKPLMDYATGAMRES